MNKLFMLLCSVLFLVLTFSACSNPNTSLILTPTPVDTSALDMQNNEILDLFQNKLYPNAMNILGWLNSNGLILDEAEYMLTGNGVKYVRVTNINTLGDVKANLQLVFSKKFTAKTVYPYFTQGDTPIFIEYKDRLFVLEGGIGFGEAPDFTRAEIQIINENSFTVSVPLLLPDGTISRNFSYEIIAENGNWVFQTFSFF